MRILVVRLGSLGDLVHTLPAVAALRRAHADAEIDWLVDAVHRPFLALVPVISSIVVLRDRTVGAWLTARRSLRRHRYDVALDFQGLLKSAALARLSGARRVAGFDRGALREPAAAWFYTERTTTSDTQHVIHKNLALARAAGGNADGRLEFPIAPVTSPAADAVRARGIGEFAIINPGAAWPNKRWPPANFGRLAALIGERHGLRSVVLWGPGEQPLAEAVVAASGAAAVVAPQTDVPGLVALAREARLIISGDTGPLHIAAAVGVPAVALFGPTNPRRNGPWDPRDVSLSLYDRCDCHYERRCRRSEQLWCLGTIGVEDVAKAIGDRLEARGSRLGA